MKVMYRHYRISQLTGHLVRYRRKRDTFLPALRGGMTHCVIFGEDGKVAGVGISLCSLEDNFDYRIGRDTARDRAEKGERLLWPEWAVGYVPARFLEWAAAEKWIESQVSAWAGPQVISFGLREGPEL